MTNALTEARAVIGEAGAIPPGSEFDRVSAGFNENPDDRYVYLRFKHGAGQPPTHVRVKVTRRQVLPR
jgi:hypothetical protein